jgi:molecular chaperone GrpE (heat shock protein)
MLEETDEKLRDTPSAVDAAAPQTGQGSAEGVADVQTSIERLERLFRDKLDRDDAKSRLLDAIFRRLEQLENDFVFREFRKPVAGDLLALLDRIRRMAQEEYLHEATCTAFESVAQEVLEILRRQGINRIEQTSTQLDESFQEVVSVDDSLECSEQGTVLRVVRDGFMYRDRVFRRQGVVVARGAGEGGNDGETNRH